MSFSDMQNVLQNASNASLVEISIFTGGISERDLFLNKLVTKNDVEYYISYIKLSENIWRINDSYDPLAIGKKYTEQELIIELTNIIEDVPKIPIRVVIGKSSWEF